MATYAAGGALAGLSLWAFAFMLIPPDGKQIRDVFHISIVAVT